MENVCTLKNYLFCLTLVQKMFGHFLGDGGIKKKVCLPQQKKFKEIKYLLYFLQLFPYNSHNLFVKRDEEMD